MPACNVTFVDVDWSTSYDADVDALDIPKIRRRAQYDPV